VLGAALESAIIKGSARFKGRRATRACVFDVSGEFIAEEIHAGRHPSHGHVDEQADALTFRKINEPIMHATRWAGAELHDAIRAISG
jgi:hypothetical protein